MDEILNQIWNTLPENEKKAFVLLAIQIAFIDDLITYEGESMEELETEFKETVDWYVEQCEETGKVTNMDHCQARKIAQKILGQSERKRIEFAELEAIRGIQYGN